MPISFIALPATRAMGKTALGSALVESMPATLTDARRRAPVADAYDFARDIAASDGRPGQSQALSLPGRG